jgi:hypothetical protein
MNSLTKVLLEDILEADDKKITAIYGGGFKPPTKGHFDVVQKAAEQNPEIDEFIIYVGGGVRDGISQAESIMIWELYKKYLPLKVRVEPVKTPVGDILRYAKEHPEEEVLWVIGARENNPEDFSDIASRTRTMEKYPNLELRVIQTAGGVSGTAARKAVRDNNKEQFFHLIPDIEEKDQVWDIVSPIIKENLFKDLKGVLKSIWSKGGKLTQDIIDGAKREGKETSKLVQLLNKMLHGDSITDDEKTFMKAQGKDLLKILPLVAIQGIPLPIPITPLLLVLGKKFGFNILPDSHEVMPLSNLAEIVTDTDIICDNCGWDWPIADGGDDLYICHKCGHDNNPDLEEGTCGYDTDVKTGKKLNTPGGLEEGRPKKKDPRKGTGKKPEGSSRRLYTDEDPKDTVSIKFKTKEDIVDTLNKKQFKAKSHARQSQVINLIHQRVRAAYNKSKDPEVRSRLKRALDYIEKRKEMSKKKTERLRKLNENSIPSINIKEKLDQINKYMISKGYNIEPLPSVEIIDNDKENAENYLGKTAYYDPNKKKIVLYTFGRHPKDISRSYTHEMIHHIQNLEDRLGNITTTNTLEDDHLDKIEQEANLKGTMTFRNFTDSLQEKKDPFGLNAYARELALGLEETLSEGRYDSIVTQLARYTIKGWKDDQEHGEPSSRLEFEVGPGKDLEYGDLEFLYKGVAVFAGIESYTYNGYAKSVSGEVGLEFAIPTSELPKMWEQIYNDITNTLRHEIEHLTQGGKNVKPNKAMASDSDLRNQLDVDGNTVDYYILPKEIDANLQGLYLKAKKTRQPFDKVVDSYLKYNLNLSLDDQEKVKNAWRPRIKALSLPKI